MKDNSIKEISVGGLTAKLEANNTWYVSRPYSHKIGFINAEFDGVYITDKYTSLSASELNALVHILDQAYQLSLNHSPLQ